MPRSAPGIAYLIFMLIGAGTVFLVAHQPVSYGIGTVTILLLIAISVHFIQLSLGYVEQSRSIAEASPDPGGIPYRWLVKSLIPLGYGLLVLQQLAHLVRLLQQKHPATGTTAVTPAVTTAKEDGHV